MYTSILQCTNQFPDLFAIENTMKYSVVNDQIKVSRLILVIRHAILKKRWSLEITSTVPLNWTIFVFFAFKIFCLFHLPTPTLEGPFKQHIQSL